MTSNLRCPVCSAELSKIDDTFFMACPDCDKLLIGTPQLWHALIQAKQDLEIATKAMNQVMSMGAKNNICYHLKAKKEEK